MNLTFWVYQDASRQWRWNLKAGNNRTIADSGEGYHSRSDCIAGINLVAGSNGAPIRDR
jgi:uncharacterized protein YegP (UPF0339 family)